MLKQAFAIAVATAFLSLAVAAQAQTSGPVSYPDSEKGLERLMEDLRNAAESDDSAAFAVLVQPLVLRDPNTWFMEVFGENLGAYAASGYRKQTSELARPLLNSFRKIRSDGFETLEVARLSEPCSPGTLENEYPILLSRKKKKPMYGVRYRKGDRYRSFGLFAYVEGGFRYLGHVGLPPATKAISLDEIRKSGAVVVASNLQQAKLIVRPAPIYPPRARAAGIQGTVHLQAVIGKDGKVKDLQFMSGHCWLAEAAIETVSRWRYSPTLLDGSPTEVSTTIDVVFQLSR